MQIQPSFRARSGMNTGTGTSELLGAMQPAAVSFYPADAVIYAQGETAGPLYLIEFGCVRICKVTADGRRQISAFHMAGEVFGFEASGVHDSFAESVEGVGLRRLRPASPDQAAGMMLQLALRNLARTEQHLMVLGRRSAGERLAALLLDLADRQESDVLVRLPMQRLDIADYLGLTLETVSRVLRTLKEQRTIRLRSTSDIEILDIAALRALCD